MIRGEFGQPHIIQSASSLQMPCLPTVKPPVTPLLLQFAQVALHWLHFVSCWQLTGIKSSAHTDKKKGCSLLRKLRYLLECSYTWNIGGQNAEEAAVTCMRRHRGDRQLLYKHELLLLWTDLLTELV